MFDQQRIRDDLLNLDIREGAKLIVHSSYKAIGDIMGGPQTFLDVLMDAVGSSGTVMMPVFQDVIADVFDLDETPSDCGIITELFKKMEGTLRSFHPTHSVAVKGAGALDIVKKHEFATALGINSPMHYFIDLGAEILFIGVDHNRVSAVHIAERIVGVPYINLPWNDQFAQPVKVLRNGAIEEFVIEECPGCSENFGLVGEKLKEKGLIRTSTIGDAVTQKVRGKDEVNCAMDILKTDPLSLLCSDQKCHFCPRARKMATLTISSERIGSKKKTINWGCSDKKL
jgi:aminoglycoside 3-N-acetyltransferase